MNHPASSPPTAAPRWPRPNFLRFEYPNTARTYDWAAGGSFPISQEDPILHFAAARVPDTGIPSR
ncbi:hypothetical protein SacmaDRAFT_4199 [Saccharomonospora marina XMU15]|uniref:Uncharacterized protein n=1 Tax=Saccharomonospora marina XMU15 TaxID=882083 RepID=H5X6W3_9PSEU|nr:hypothetical protein [Saccharomonospora marina]EHR52392.1 hypothetical protein SacmaDRAFT_4199 [Saccharomonospora marina XMU15]